MGDFYFKDKKDLEDFILFYNKYKFNLEKNFLYLLLRQEDIKNLVRFFLLDGNRKNWDYYLINEVVDIYFRGDLNIIPFDLLYPQFLFIVRLKGCLSTVRDDEIMNSLVLTRDLKGLKTIVLSDKKWDVGDWVSLDFFLIEKNDKKYF